MFMYCITKLDRISHKLIDARWLNEKNTRMLQSAFLYRKIIREMKPNTLYHKVTLKIDVHTVNLRFRGRIPLPAHKTA